MQFNIKNIDSLPSTNSYLANSIRESENINEGFVINATEQTHGKGTGTNIWESETAKNLTFSLLLKPNFINASEQFTITQLISVSLIDALKDFCKPEKLKIKWPNDIYYGDKKLCGMLIQNTIKGNRIENSIIGIGLNVNQTKFSENIPNPVSLKQINAKDFETGNILSSVLKQISANYERLVIYPASGWLKSRYLNLLYRLNSTHTFSDGSGSFKGEIKGTDQFGRLIISCNGEERVYAFKEVEYKI